MKPQHIGLLVAGAALAGGLAVKMTQPPQIPVAARVAPQVNTPPVLPARVVEVAKTKPFPDEAPPMQTPADAPAVVYSDPPKKVIRQNKPNSVAPVQIAELPKEKPIEWTPGHYVSPPTPTVPRLDPPPEAPQPAVPDPAPVEPPVEQAARPVSSSPDISLPVAPRQATLRTGMTISIRLNESLSSDRNATGDTFQASLAEPLVVDGLVIAEKGARVTGRIVDSHRAGRVNGTSLLELELSSVETSDGQRVSISTDPWTKQGNTSHREDAETIGGGAALGAIIGAIAGGGAGAAIGAGIGGGAGAGTIMATRGKPVNVPTETIIRFRLASRVTITEQQIAGR